MTLLPQTRTVAGDEALRTSRPHVLIIVQNLPVPLDRRVWLECQALVASGYEVSVICPKGPGDESRQVIDGVHIYKYRPTPQARGLLGYIVEFLYSWLRTAQLSLSVWRRCRFSVIQACNPPDTYWLLARFWRIRGVRFIFDQHDLNPELLRSRFGERDDLFHRLQLRALLWLERMTYQTADRVISTNESYKSVAVERGARSPSDVTVVRSGPDTRVMRPIYPDRPPSTTQVFSLVYLGIMGPQDDVDIILDVMDELVHRRLRRDVHATLMGFGDCLNQLRRRCTELNLDEWVTFTGRADKAMIADHLSVADIGLSPDLKTPLNDLSTMNKTMEYMAYAVPSVAFDLLETQVSGGESVLYVPSGDLTAFADAVEQLLDDPALRLSMALRARARVSRELDWRPQAHTYMSVYDDLSGIDRVESKASLLADLDLGPGFDDRGRPYVDLNDREEFERFILQRCSPMNLIEQHSMLDLDDQASIGEELGALAQLRQSTSVPDRSGPARQQLTGANLELTTDNAPTTMRDKPMCDNAQALQSLNESQRRS
jgi:glycosyltransferase involved in cell wall biosynthesis